MYVLPVPFYHPPYMVVKMMMNGPQRAQREYTVKVTSQFAAGLCSSVSFVHTVCFQYRLSFINMMNTIL